MKNGTGEKCPRCGGNLNSTNQSGSITQWVANCACALHEAQEDDPNLEICQKCKKRISAGRAGSLTQWIFRSDLCGCDMPETGKSRMTIAAETAAANANKTTSRLEESEKELDIDPEKFPVDRYAPISILGSGMAGTVYRCNDRLLRKKVAIKLLTNVTPEQLLAFQGEARAASKLNHPNVVKVMDFGVTVSGAPFMVMEFVQGNDLGGILHHEKTINVTAALYIFGRVCDGLAEAHKHNIFHRDIKNSNILVGALESHKPEVRLIDFGVASFRSINDSKAAAQGATLVGTPAFMSPDQALGKTYDARSEVYSLGCALFEALTGSTPFTGKTALDLINKHAHEPPPRLSDINEKVDFSNQLEKLVAKCLEKNPNDRYQSMAELSSALNSLAIGELPDSTVSAESESLKTTTTPPSPSKILLASGILLIGIWSIFNWRMQESEIQSSPLASKQTSKISLADRAPKEAFSERFIRRKYNGINYIVSTGDLIDAELAELKTVRDFKGLYILSEEITGAGLEALQSNPIEYLEINNTPITDDGFRAIAKIKALKHVTLGDMNISESQLAELSKLPALETLDLTNSTPSKNALSALGSFPNLRTLVLANVKQTGGAALRAISKLKNLKSLNLTFTALQPADYPQLQGLTSVTAINMNDSKVDDRVFEYLKALPLQMVSLDRTQITGSGFHYLYDIPSLKRLSIRDCKKVTTDSVLKLVGAMPNCTIVSKTD